MQKNIFYLLFTIISLLGFQNCGLEDCNPVLFNELSLEEESKSFINYPEIDKVIFVDKDSIEYIYEALTIGPQSFSNYMEIPCREDETTRVSYDAERYFSNIENANNTRIYISLSVSFLENETIYESENLVDLIMMNIHNDTNTTLISETLNIITSNRGGDVDAETFNNNSYTFTDNITLLDKTFENVYVQNVNSNPIYYNKEFGVIGFNDNTGTFLVFDRFE